MPRDRLNLVDLRERYVDKARPLPSQVEELLRSDPRKGAQDILHAIEKRRHENRAEGQRLRKMVRYEQELWDQGVKLVCGVDEAGMSPLAGPVAAGAVIFPEGTRIAEVDDSKKLDARTRERLAPVIKERAIAWSVAFVDPEEIDRINIYWAGILCMRRAIEGLSVRPEHLLIDARKLKEIDLPQTSIIKGDAKSLSIAAASILAKTARDALMDALDRQYPGYGFAHHKGYPVKEHAAALKKLGACPVHRRSFVPVREALGLPPLPPWPTAEERAQRGTSPTA